MNLRPDKRYFSAAVYAGGVILFTVLFALLVWYFGTILGFFVTVFETVLPLVYGFVLAYLLFPLQHGIEVRLLSRKKLGTKVRLCRILSVVIAFLVLLVILGLLGMSIVPSITNNYSDLVSQISSYMTDAGQWISGLFHGKTGKDIVLPISGIPAVDLPKSTDGYPPNLLYTTVSQAESNGALSAVRQTLEHSVTLAVGDAAQNILNVLYDYFTDLAPQVLNLAVSIVNGAKNLFIGMIVSVYLLLSREHFVHFARRSIRAILPTKLSDRFLRVSSKLNRSFSSFLSKRLIDAALMFSMLYLPMMLFGFPFASLVATGMAVVSFVPYVGPFVGSIPALFIEFIADPSRGIGFLILLCAVGWFDLYFVERRLLKSDTGLSPAWALIAVVVFGRLLGGWGFFLAVPVTIVLYDYLSRAIRRRELSPKL